MSKGTKKCKVCGAEYEYCKTNRPAGVFRYQDVACCPEHGSIYLAQIIESRTKNTTSSDDTDTTSDDTSTTEETLDGNEDDELFEEEFDDDADEPVIETE